MQNRNFRSEHGPTLTYTFSATILCRVLNARSLRFMQKRASTQVLHQSKQYVPGSPAEMDAGFALTETGIDLLPPVQWNPRT